MEDTGSAQFMPFWFGGLHFGSNRTNSWSSLIYSCTTQSLSKSVGLGEAVLDKIHLKIMVIYMYLARVPE